MFKHLRYALLPSLLVVGGLGCPTLSLASIDQGIVTLLPAGTTAVFGINADEARGSAFGQFLLNDPRWQNSHFQKVMSDTGFDPRRDLHSFVVAGLGGSPQGANPPDTTSGGFAVIARGAFNSSKITQAALQRGSTLQTIGGADVYVSPGPNSNATPSGFTLLDSDLAAFGDLTTLGKVIAAHNSANQISSDLTQLIGKAASANDVWFASLGSPLFNHPAAGKDSNQPAPSAQVLQSITQSSGGLKFGPSVVFTFDALAKSEKDATSIGDVIRFFASAAQVNQDQNTALSPLAPAIQNLNLVTSGTEVLLTTSLPEANLEQLTKVAPGVGVPSGSAVHGTSKAH